MHAMGKMLEDLTQTFDMPKNMQEETYKNRLNKPLHQSHFNLFAM